MDWWQAVILGLVEGITEYLPVSSTGHLILASSLMGLDDPERKAAVDAFNIVIQGGAILAVLGLYVTRVKQMVLGLFGRDPQGLRLAMLILVAFLPAAILGFLFDDLIEARLFFPIPVLAALGVGGVYMIALDIWQKRRPDSETEADITDLTFAQALLIGCMQVVAMWPGTSRSMMTITGGVLVGLKPKQAAEFSFLLGLPTLGGATLYKLAKNIKESADAGEANMFEMLGVTPVIIGLIVATVSAALAVKWLVSFLNKHGLAVFGYYRLLLCVVLAAAIAADVVSIEPPPADHEDVLPQE